MIVAIRIVRIEMLLKYKFFDAPDSVAISLHVVSFVSGSAVKFGNVCISDGYKEKVNR